MSRDYEMVRKQYLPKNIHVLFIAESPPPSDPKVPSSRHFYRSDIVRRDDRLFINTMRALYPDAVQKTEAELEQEKDGWLRKFRLDGYYMIEALNDSLPHEITKKQRRQLIADNIPVLIGRVQKLAGKHTKIILIKSNVFDVAAQPLKDAGFTVLNSELVDYPGQYNQRAYRKKIAALLGVES